MVSRNVVCFWQMGEISNGQSFGLLRCVVFYRSYLQQKIQSKDDQLIDQLFSLQVEDCLVLGYQVEAEAELRGWQGFQGWARIRSHAETTDHSRKLAKYWTYFRYQKLADFLVCFPPRSINPPVTRRGVLGVTGRSWSLLPVRILRCGRHQTCYQTVSHYSWDGSCHFLEHALLVPFMIIWCSEHGFSTRVFFS